MIIGVPKEIKDNENRVSITPYGVKELIDLGHKVLIQKSGYFSRSSKANKNDLELIFKSVELAVDIVLDNGESGVVGLDEDNNNQLNCIKFERIKGGKAFDYNVDWFQSILKEIKQI